MEKKDEEIMLEYQAGNEDAISYIFSRYKLRIFNFCLKILAHRADAEDVTSDVFLSLFSKKYVFHPEAKFSTWLFTIARNSCINRIRKKKPLVSIWFKSSNDSSTTQWEFQDDNDLPDQQLQNRQMQKHVRLAISGLPLEQREALVLREYEKCSYDDISFILDCSLEKVKILIFRAREQLKQDLVSFMKEGEDHE